MTKTIFSIFMALIAICGASAQQNACPPPNCACEEGLTEMELYYLGAESDQADIEVYGVPSGTGPIATFSGVASGTPFTVSAAGLANGVFPQRLRFQIASQATGETCEVRIYAQCPRGSAWPGAEDDLQVLGKKIGPLLVSSHTSAGSSTPCNVSTLDQQWRVGGNVLGAGSASLGSLDNAPIEFITDGEVRAHLSPAGRLMVGTGVPEAQLHVEQDARVDAGLRVGQNLEVGGGIRTDKQLFAAEDITTGQDLIAAGDVRAYRDVYSNSIYASSRAIIDDYARIGGHLAVGVPDGLHQDTRHVALFNGSVIATELTLKLFSNWPDYVFEEDYPAPDLKAWEAHIRAHKHLPGMPSAAEVEEEGGFELGEMSRLLLEKVEELTLICLQQQKEIDALREQVQLSSGEQVGEDR
jgi:hypothetical protein